MSPYERLMQRVSRPSDGGCWLWTGGTISTGYGAFSVAGKHVLVHRFVYEHFFGPIPSGLVIDHTCHGADPICVGKGCSCEHRRCVNPDHLEAVTGRENSLRGRAPSVLAYHSNTCHRGHDLSDALVIKTGPQKGRRNCRACRNERHAVRASDPAWRARRAAYERERQRRKRFTEAAA